MGSPAGTISIGSECHYNARDGVQYQSSTESIIPMSTDSIVSTITGRETSLFSADVDRYSPSLHERIGKSRILVIGGAGSIGSATIRAMIPYRPKVLHVVDQNENGLAELVRDLRSRELDFEVEDFKTFPLDFGSPVMERFLDDSPPYDCILNFAALKHVRSEKDIYSLIQLLDTNIVKCARLLDWLSRKETPYQYFSVSTDKAANPVGFMGASKRVMEHLAFSQQYINKTASSARFANVAFSDGSLLDSFLRRIEKRQPLAAPRDTKRYFISMQEAGQICLLAAFCAPEDRILIPRLDPKSDLIELEAVAKLVLRHHGFEAKIYSDERLAKENVQSDMNDGRYPLVLTSLDTSGEKPFEEFVGEGETTVEVGMKNVLAIPYQPVKPGVVKRLLDEITDWIQNPNRQVAKEDLFRLIAEIVPQFQHKETGKNLDQRM